MTDPAETAGPNADGSKHLAPESKVGHAVSIIVSTAALGVADALGALDLSGLPVWLNATAAVAIGTLAGLIASWAKRNRPGNVSARY